MSDNDITMRELVVDKLYRKWLTRAPVVQTSSNRPWRVWAQKDAGGPWQKKDFAQYAEAYRFFTSLFKSGYHDLALGNRVGPQKPPVVSKLVGGKKMRYRHSFWLRPGMGSNEEWCCFCRRPTTFTWFKRHHAVKMPSLLPDRRCTICGVRLIHVHDMMRRGS